MSFELADLAEVLPIPDIPSSFTLQLMRPDCDIEGFDVHAYITTVGLGPQVGVAVWRSRGTAWTVGGDRASHTVYGCNRRFIRKRNEAVQRPHTVMSGAGFSIISGNPTLIDEGHPAQFLPFSEPMGKSWAVFGPSKIRAEIDSASTPAVIGISPGTNGGWGNHLVCYEGDYQVPTSNCLQTPNSVFMGMSLAEYVANVLAPIAVILGRILLDMLLGAISKALTGVLFRAAGWLARRIGPTLARAFFRFSAGTAAGRGLGRLLAMGAVQEFVQSRVESLIQSGAEWGFRQLYPDVNPGSVYDRGVSHGVEWWDRED